MKLKECPVSQTLKLIGGKWKPMIIYQLKEGTKRSRQLARDISEASGKVLTAQLRELEVDGIVQRRIYPTVPAQVEYSLTPLGKSLTPVLKALIKWGQVARRQQEQKPR